MGANPGLFLLLTLLVAVAIVCFSVAVASGAQSSEDKTKNEMGKRFETSGIQIGDTLDTGRLVVYDNFDRETTLDRGWKNNGKPTFVLTVSITCPYSVRSIPHFNRLASNKSVNCIVIYTIEARPNDGNSPYKEYKGKKFLNLHGQPKTIRQRISLADRFFSGIPSVNYYVDNMDNNVWLALGGGPNMALLFDKDGKLLIKQGWYDAPAMLEYIKSLSKEKR